MENIRIAREYLDHVIVVDNTPSVSNSPFPDNLIRVLPEELGSFALPEKLEKSSFLVFNGVNLGLSKSYNRAISIARKLLVDYVLFLDQDSRLLPNTIQFLMESLVEVRSMNVGALGCTNLQPDVSSENGKKSIGLQPKTYFDGELAQEVFIKENSGLLVSMRNLDIAGNFNETFFLDGVDYDFCLNLREQGFRIYRSRKAIILQEAGTPSKARILGREFAYSIRAPERTRLIMESYLRLTRLHKSQASMLILKIFLEFAFLNFKILFLYRKKFDHYGELWRGILLGLSNLNPGGD